MSWSEGILSVWQWGKQGLLTSYDYHLRPDCPKCADLQPLPSLPSIATQTTPGAAEMALARSGLVRIAGLSGAAAVALGAYGAHVLSVAKEDVTEEQRKAFEVANRYHLIHSVALLGVSLARRPSLSGFLMVGGILGFCGTTYYHAFTGDRQFRQFTPYGGVLLIAAWLSLIL